MVYGYLTTVLSTAPIVTAELLQPGEILRGKYRIERVLGSGGMGTVVLATHLRLSQLCAIKVLRKETQGRDDVVLRFAREARAASKLRGDHAVRILDVDDSDGGDPFLVMEFLEGADLHQHLLASGPLSIEEAVGYLLQTCEGLAEAHAAGIIHRDLKPANLFLTTRADGSHLVKILDFGISKAMDPDAPGDFQITKPATAIGSPSYMSPEQLKNAANVDGRTDIWSLGIVLYQLLTNALPFEATGTAALAAHIAADPPASMRSIRPDVPEDLERVVLKCLEKIASSRFADITELAQALAPFASGGASGAARVARVAERRRAEQEKGGRDSSVLPPAVAPNEDKISRPPSPGTASLPGVGGIAASPLQRALETEYGSTVGASGTASLPKKRRWVIPTALASMVIVVVATWTAARVRPASSLPVVISSPVRESATPSVPPELTATKANLLGKSEDVGAPAVTRLAPSSSSLPVASKRSKPSVAPAVPKSSAPSKDNPMDIDFR